MRARVRLTRPISLGPRCQAVPGQFQLARNIGTVLVWLSLYTPLDAFDCARGCLGSNLGDIGCQSAADSWHFLPSVSGFRRGSRLESWSTRTLPAGRAP